MYPDYVLKVDLMLNENQHNHWSNILACQIDDSLSYKRLWNGINGDRIGACHIDFYIMFQIKFFLFLSALYRIPAVYLAAGSTKLHVTSSVNDYWNYNWNSNDIPVDTWFNLRIQQRKG